MSTTFKGGTSEEGTGTAPATGLPLHASAEVNDFVVISGAGVDVTDARFAVVGASQTWVGPATTLADVEYTNTGFHWAIACAVFTPARLGDDASATGTSNPGTLPQVQSLGIVIAGMTGSTGSLGVPDGFTNAVNKDQGVAFVRIVYKLMTGTSPAAEFTAGTAWLVSVLTARLITPPLRRYPREDRYGVGSANRRIPPPRTARLAGGYY